MYSSYRRRVLSKWKRRQNWIIYNQIISNWVLDYTFNKKSIKNQFFESIFLHASSVYNFQYIKKKSPLDNFVLIDFISSSFPKKFLTYFLQKFNYKNNIAYLNLIKNNNFVSVFFYLGQDQIIDTEKIINLSIRSENDLYLNNNNSQNLKKYVKPINWIESFFKSNLYLSLNLYKSFIFFFFFNLIKYNQTLNKNFF